MEVAINAAGHVFVVLLMVMMFAATIRFTFHRVLPAPTSDVVKLCTGVGWALLAILFSFGTIGEFARGEVSPVPWTEFSNRLPAH